MRSLVIAFTLAIFLSATLLFSVQPLFGKLALPILGGSAAVWNTAMVFFQTMLLLGYAYAWAIARFLPLVWQATVHILVTVAGFLFLPLALQAGVPPTGETMPTAWLLGVFAMSIGVPFFALSANAPLLQSWFSRTDHPDAPDPYFLYAASNLGSLLVLCAYPVIIEPLSRVAQQAQAWTVGYILFGVVLTGCIILALRKSKRVHVADESVQTDDVRISMRSIALWLLLAFIPSSLMLGVTTWLSTNIAAVPLLWVAPLALYLLTFVIVFSKRVKLNPRYLSLFAAAGIIMCTLGHFHIKPALAGIAINLTGVFAISLFLHARLAQTRPPASQLTLFYLMMSFGGVLGGVFNAVLAPQIFSGVLEYAVILWLAALTVLAQAQDARRSWTSLPLITGLIFAITVGFAVALGYVQALLFVLGTAVMAMVLFLARWRVQNSVVALLAAVTFLVVIVLPREPDVFRDRSFYSALRVTKVGEGLEERHLFYHGDTLHNEHFRHPTRRTLPLAYYIKDNTLDLVVKAVRAANSEAMTVSVVGLGAGALACFERPGETWTYFEIDPLVVDMAKDPELFSFLEECSPNADIRIGDARLKLEDLPDRSQDLIMMDAFTSDSVPAHLLTREAMQLYRRKLAPGGVVFFHTSNRILDISSVVAATAAEEGLAAHYIFVDDMSDLPFGEYGAAAEGLLVGEADRVAQITYGDYWMDYPPAPHVRAWTDDYSPILAPMLSFGRHQRLTRGQNQKE